MLTRVLAPFRNITSGEGKVNKFIVLNLFVLRSAWFRFGINGITLIVMVLATA